MYQQPAPYQLPTPPGPRRRARTVLIVIGSVFGGFLLIGIIGAALGLGKKAPAAPVAAFETTRSATATVTTRPAPAIPKPKPSTVHADKPSARPSPARATVKPSPSATPKPPTDLVFTGAVTATADAAVNVLPKTTTSNYGTASTPGWSTQCVFDGDGTTAWSATVTVRTPGNEWSITISNGESFGNPNPGAYVGIEQPEANFPTDALSLGVESTGPIAAGMEPDADDETDYGYYTPLDHNGGNGAVTVDKGLTAGTLDVWLTPDQPTNNVLFHLVGTWACA